MIEERQQGRPLAVPTVEEFLDREFDTWEAESCAALHPADTERIVVLGVELIANLQGGEPAPDDVLRREAPQGCWAG